MDIQKLYEALSEAEKKELHHLVQEKNGLIESIKESEFLQDFETGLFAEQNSLLEKADEKKKHYLFTTYFKSDNQERQAEYDFCIAKNKVADFDKVYLFVENKAEDIIAARKIEAELKLLPLVTSTEIEVVIMDSRPNFRDFFDFMSAYEFRDSVNIIANTDIFFLNMQQIDKHLHLLQSGKSCFALTRWDYHHNRPSNLFETNDSQDTWIFNGNQRVNLIENCEYPMGKLGCDNRLAYEIEKAGFIVTNPSRTIQTFHLHDVPVRTYNANDPSAKVPKPYLLLEPTKI